MRRGANLVVELGADEVDVVEKRVDLVGEVLGLFHLGPQLVQVVLGRARHVRLHILDVDVQRVDQLAQRVYYIYMT